jgi:POT family proton-dependent oligopeptide transporter
MSVAQAEATTFEPPPAGEFLGHPRALWNLFGAEFWERFCYYGMRAILGPYVAVAFFSHTADPEATASLTYGGYTSMVYMTGILGGYVADRILGYQRSIMLGGSLMAVGMFMLLSPQLTTFLMGLAVIVVGNGMFKPNISTMVGKLYRPGDIRRDSGFTIFYMGINAGAFLAPIICSTWIGVRYGMKYGFLAAGIGMIFGLMVFQAFKGALGNVGKPIPGRTGVGPIAMVLVAALVVAVPIYLLLSYSDILGGLLAILMLCLCAYFVYSGVNSGSREQTHRYIAMLILFLANICFWALFEQAGSSLNFFARDYVTPMFGTEEDWLRGSYQSFQSANPIFILLLAPLFAALWPKLDRVRINPSIPRKFAFGLLGAGLGFLVLVLALKARADEAAKVSWLVLTLCYLIHTMGELCLSPIGLSMVTKLARPQEVGLAMGGWFLSIGTANYLAGRIAAVATAGSKEGPSSSASYLETFTQLSWGGIIIAAVFLVLAPFINKLMHGVK